MWKRWRFYREMYGLAGLSLQIPLHAHQQRVRALPNVEVGLRAQPLYDSNRSGKVALLRSLDDDHVLGTNTQGYGLTFRCPEIAGVERNFPPAHRLERGSRCRFSLRRARREDFIRGDPMKVATNVLSGWR